MAKAKAAGAPAPRTSSKDEVIVEYHHNGQVFRRAFTADDHDKPQATAKQFIETHNAKHPNDESKHAQIVKASDAPTESEAQDAKFLAQKAKREKKGDGADLLATQ